MVQLERKRLDWAALAPLRLRARTVAEGYFAGAHRSTRRGAGVEFGEHRNYVPGDDLRFLDRRMLMRHGRLMVRVFETETERSLCLVVDASRSMAFKSPEALETKLSYASLLAAALTRVALSEGDRVSLDWLGGTQCYPVSALGGRTAFERLVDALENAAPTLQGATGSEDFEQLVDRLDRRSRRGAVIVLLSDLLDLEQQAPQSFARLASRGRTPVVLRVLDPVEKNFSFKGSVRLRSSETSRVIETDTDAVRAQYLAALEASKLRWAERLVAVGGRVVDCTTADDPVSVLRKVLLSDQGLSQ